MEGRVRVLTASGIKTLFKVWLIKYSLGSEKHTEMSSMKRLVTGSTRSIGQGCEESCSECSSQACCLSDSISVTSHNCASDGANTKTQQ